MRKIDIENKTPYLVVGGTVYDIIVDLEIRNRKIIDQMNEFMNEYGATRRFLDTKLRGLVFDKSPPPDGWINFEKYPSNVYIPPVRSEARAKMEALPKLNDSIVLFQKLGHDKETIVGNRILYPSTERIGATLIIHIPNIMIENGYIVPEGCKKLLYSEYFRIVEESKEAGE